MTDAYVDVRTFLAGYERDLCADCGTEQWFKLDDVWDDWRCMECNRCRVETLELPCSECATRMDTDDGEWVCRYCGHSEDFDREELVDRMTAEFQSAAGYDYGRFTECPVCGARRGVHCHPDGERVCQECDEFYVGRFMRQWFAYAIWLDDPERARVQEVDDA